MNILRKKNPQSPEMRVKVVGCFIEHSGRILTIKRSMSKPQGGKWGLPSGKVSKSESLKKAIQREILEETGLSLPERSFKYIGFVRVVHKYPIIYHMFSARLPKRPSHVALNSIEHTDFDWLTTKELLERSDLIEDLDICIEIYEGKRV